MSFFRNLSIVNKFLLGFGLIVVVVAFLIGDRLSPIVILTISLLLIISVLITKGISDSLVKFTVLIKEIAAGKIGTPIEPQFLERKDEIGQLAAAFKEMTVRLKKTLDDLAESNRRIEQERVKDEAILVAIGDGLVVTDNAGKILFINNSFEDILGWRAMEVLGKHIFDVIPSEDEQGKRLPNDRRALSIALRTGKKAFPDVPSNHYYVRKDGNRFPVTVTATPIVLGEKITGAVEVFRDISKEKEIDRAKSEFVSLASHQLRTPLSTTSWYAEMLLSGDVGKITPAQRKYLEEVYHANQRMVELVNALLNVSRIELGTFAIEPELVDITRIGREALSELKPQIAERKLSVTTKFESGFPKMQADPRLTRIIFQNLLTNAVKYTPERGKVTIAVERKGPDALITISDTGFGIPESARPKIFTKLFRADNVQERESDGTGLGLYIVKAIVDAAGGTIRFDSVENKGTTFFVTLPLSGMRQKTGSKGLTEERLGPTKPQSK